MTDPTPARAAGKIVRADAARVVLVGAPGPLRSAVIRQLPTALLDCLDTPEELPHMLTPAMGARPGTLPS